MKTDVASQQPLHQTAQSNPVNFSSLLEVPLVGVPTQSSPLLYSVGNITLRALTPVFAAFCGAKQLSYLHAWEILGDHILANDLWMEGAGEHPPYIRCDDPMKTWVGFEKATIYALAQILPRHMNQDKVVSRFYRCLPSGLAVHVYNTASAPGGLSACWVVLEALEPTSPTRHGYSQVPSWF